MLVTPMPLVKSRYRSPVADARYEPLPEAISISLIGRAIPSASLSRARTRADCGAADADVDADAAVESLRQQWMPARGSGRRVSMDDDSMFAVRVRVVARLVYAPSWPNFRSDVWVNARPFFAGEVKHVSL